MKEINAAGKWLAGTLIIIFILFPIWLIMAYWPNKIPDTKDKIKPLYIDELYHVRLACIPDSICCIDSILIKSESSDTIVKIIADTLVKKDDTSALAVANRNAKIAPHNYYQSKKLIDLNTILLILIAAAGFLGNMIHIATSLTTFVGNEQFKKSWILWYFVKPFTAAALAMGLYFVFRAGFLNYSADAASINIYGVLTISLLAGLFTDKATLKLAEVFDVIFSVKSGDKRTDKLEKKDIKFLSVSPDKLVTGQPNSIIIKGENLDSQKLIFKINDILIDKGNITITPATITLIYTIPATPEGMKEFKLSVIDETDKELFSKTFGL